MIVESLKPTHSTIADRVAGLRASHGESLREASIRTGVSHTTIARIEKGEVTGSFHSTLKKVSDGYGVDVHWLLTGSTKDPEVTYRMQREQESVERIQGELFQLAYVAARQNGILPEKARELAKALREHVAAAIATAKEGR